MAIRQSHPRISPSVENITDEISKAKQNGYHHENTHDDRVIPIKNTGYEMATNSRYPEGVFYKNASCHQVWD
ncbi:uncharacterized protein METZ01_LOCUS340746 [marine metagenome]|uniref:Uncharacterized protein n=1 Tax=marine metagenome TaxID=408172 RepID=A0A382QSS5_9ZZZZ